MTTTDLDRATSLHARRRQRLAHVLASELLKARTLRAQRLLWVAAVAAGLVGTAAALVFAQVLTSLDEGIPAGEVDALILRAPTAGAVMVAVVLGFAAIHLSANERSSGRELLTALTVPARGRTFVARVAVAAAVAFAASVLTFALGGGMVRLAGAALELSSAAGPADQALRVVATAVGTTLVAVLAAGVGLGVRNGTIAAGVFLVVMAVLPSVLGAAAATTGNDALASAASALPAARLSALVDATVANDVAAAALASGGLLLWAAAAVGVASVAWRAGGTWSPRAAAPVGAPS